MNFFNIYVKSIEKYLRFVGKAIRKLPPENTGGKRIGIVITPWLFTPVPWFFLTIALLIRHRGLTPVIVWDDLLFEEEPKETNIQNKAIEKVLSLFKAAGIEIHAVSKSPSVSLSGDDYVEIDRLAYLNAVWQNRTTVPSPETERLKHHYTSIFIFNLPKIMKFLQDVAVKAILVQGGIYRNSGLFLYAGQQLGIRVTTYDGGSMTGINTPAGHAMDIPNVLKSNFLRNEAEKYVAIGLAKTEFKRRYPDWNESKNEPKRALKNFNRLTYDVVITLSIDYDSQALDKSRLFENATEWLLETVHFILENTTTTVVVRQHPGEKMIHPGIRRNFILERIICSRFGNNPRFRLITCDESVKTYELMEGAKLVLPFASTIGIEAGIMGKKVIMESSAYYSGLPFAPQAISKQDYFKQIWESLDSVSLKQDETAVENALLVFYLSQICNRIQTNFVPEPPYFDKWVEHDFESLLYDDNISVLIHALTEGVPVAEIQNRRLLADNLRPESDKKDTESPAIQDIIADIFLHNAFFSLNHGKSFEALKLFEVYKKSEQEPNPLAEYGRAVALARLNRLGEAIQVIKQFLIAIPNHTKAEALLLKLRLIQPKTITTP